MVRWALHHISWFAIRLAITFVCLATIKNVAHRQGFYISYEVLCTCAICMIIGIRFWMPSSRNSSPEEIEESEHERTIRHVHEKYSVPYRKPSKRDEDLRRAEFAAHLDKLVKNALNKERK